MTRTMNPKGSLVQLRFHCVELGSMHYPKVTLSAALAEFVVMHVVGMVEFVAASAPAEMALGGGCACS